MRAVLGLVVGLFLAGCQTAQPPATASGKPEVDIRAPVGAIKAALISRAINQRYNITKDTEYMLQMDKPTENFGAALLLGSKYDGVPAERVVFTFAPNGNESVRVVTSIMFVTNPGSSFERLTPINAGEGVDRTQASLFEVKQAVEAAAAPPPVAARAPPKALPKASKPAPIT
jgi:hypothetical protein